MYTSSYAHLIGRLGANPEQRFTPSGTSVASFRVAVNRQRRGDRSEQTDWYRVTAFGALADIAAQHLSTGTPVYIAGRLQLDHFTGRDGVERVTVEVIADTVLSLAGGPASGPGAGDNARAGAVAAGGQREPRLTMPDDVDDADDLPF